MLNLNEPLARRNHAFPVWPSGHPRLIDDEPFSVAGIRLRTCQA